YAMIRYDLFDLRSVIRTSTVYAAVTGVVVALYAGSIASFDLVLARLGMGESKRVPALVIALAVVLLLNPVSRRTQALVDRLFFPGRLDVQRTIERGGGSLTPHPHLRRV